VSKLEMQKTTKIIGATSHYEKSWVYAIKPV